MNVVLFVQHEYLRLICARLCSDLAASPKFATEPATQLTTYFYQAYLRRGLLHPLSATLTAAPVFFCFSFFLSCFPSFSLNQNSQGLPPLFAPHPPPTPPCSLSPSLPFFSFAPCFDSGCASLGGEDGVPQSLEGYWSCKNTGLCFSMRCHCERGLIVRVRPQKERTKGHLGVRT